MIVITGGAGFIGSNLAAALEAQGEEIAVCDRLGSGDKWRNLAKRELAALIPPEGLMPFLDRCEREIETVFHLGAISATTERDADLIIAQNFTLSTLLWDWCAARRKKFFYASSAATYGDGGEGFDDDGAPEALARLRPLNGYGWSKHLFDRRIARLVARKAPAPPQWIGLKFFNVYGPNEYHKGEMQSVVAKIFACAASGEPCRLFRSHRQGIADGGQKRDFIPVDDAIAMIEWLYARPAISGLFNAGTGAARSFADLAAAVYRALGRPPMIEYIDTPEPIRARYQYLTEARMGRLRQAGYDRAATPLEDGVRHYVETYLAASDPYR